MLTYIARFGRRLTLMLSILLRFGCTLGLAWTSSYAVFCILRFLIGVTSAGLYTTGFVLGKKKTHGATSPGTRVE